VLLCALKLTHARARAITDGNRDTSRGKGVRENRKKKVRKAPAEGAGGAVGVETRRHHHDLPRTPKPVESRGLGKEESRQKGGGKGV
jgi:hypothetical protein